MLKPTKSILVISYLVALLFIYADQAARMRRLVCFFVVRKEQSWSNMMLKTPPGYVPDRRRKYDTLKSKRMLTPKEVATVLPSLLA